MIPCHVCGEDSGAYWVTGYVPAPDSQKMALCSKHDTPENRRALHFAWYDAMRNAIKTATQNAAYFTTRGTLFMVHIHFSAGGSLSQPCTSVEITEQNTLKVVAPDGTMSFFPMQHVRRYDVMPMVKEAAASS